jgi:cytochrome c-type biogenesis protein CcmE
MRKTVSGLIVMGLVLTLVLAPGLMAQATKDAKTGLDRLAGNVVSIDKDKSTLTIRQRGSNAVVWTITYDANTKFTYRNAASTVDEVKDGRRVIVLGKFDQSNKMTASRVDVRTGK